MTIMNRLNRIERKLGPNQPTNQPPTTMIRYGTLTPTVEAEMERRRAQGKAVGLPNDFPLLVQLDSDWEREEGDDHWSNFHGNIEQLGGAIRAMLAEEMEPLADNMVMEVVVVPLEGDSYIHLL